MPDLHLDRCLDLCVRSQTASDTDRPRLLDELKNELVRLKSSHAERSLGVSSLQYEPVITMDMAGYITEWNRGAEILFGYAQNEAIGQHILFLYADEPNDLNGDVNELFLDHGSSIIEVRRRKKSGEIFRANLSLSHVIDDDNISIGMIARLTEVPDRLSAEEKRKLHALIIENSDEGILITDAEERIVSVNMAFTRITGYTASESIGRTPEFLGAGRHEADLHARIGEAMQGSGAWHGEIFSKRKNGEQFPQSVTIGVVRSVDNMITHTYSIFSDISILRAAEQRMQRIANYDSLTGLPNRTLFHQLIEQALLEARRKNDHGALMIVNLNRFTSVNDTLGHAAGDELLRQTGQRFRQALRDEDILARIGSDEFVVGLVDIQKKEHAGLVANKLLLALELPFLIDSQALHIGASIGIAIYPEDANDTATLLQCADVARKRVKGNKAPGYLFYSPEMNERAWEQWTLESELRQALVNCELQLHYQPKVSLRNGRIVGAEALVRWNHRQHGFIPPGKFIPVAEETGLIYELGAWILDEACRQIRAWKDANIEQVPVAINLSAKQFDPMLPQRLQESIARHQISSRWLKLEITESLLMRGPEIIVPIMNELVAMGFTLSLDDFGTGYSSLAYLKRFPISTLKIDRSFVVGVPGDENDCAIAQAIVTMGKQLRQEIVAEGVETEAQMHFMRHLGCDQLQGYLFSPPVTATEFERMIREKRCLTINS